MTEESVEKSENASPRSQSQEYKDKSDAEFGGQDAQRFYREHGPAIRTDAASDLLPVHATDAEGEENREERVRNTRHSGPFPINGAQADTGKSASG